MKKVMLASFLTLCAVASLEARPKPNGHRPAPPPPPPSVHHSRHWKAPSWGWGLNFSPYGTTLGIGTRVGRYGAIGISLPLITPEPVIREERTVVVQQPVVQQPVVIQQPVVVQEPVVQPQVGTPRTWVEGYWRVTRTPDGREATRVWVPGHWE